MKSLILWISLNIFLKSIFLKGEAEMSKLYSAFYIYFLSPESISFLFIPSFRPDFLYNPVLCLPKREPSLTSNDDACMMHVCFCRVAFFVDAGVPRFSEWSNRKNLIFSDGTATKQSARQERRMHSEGKYTKTIRRKYLRGALG